MQQPQRRPRGRPRKNASEADSGPKKKVGRKNEAVAAVDALLQLHVDSSMDSATMLNGELATMRDANLPTATKAAAEDHFQFLRIGLQEGREAFSELKTLKRAFEEHAKKTEEQAKKKTVLHEDLEVAQKNVMNLGHTVDAHSELIGNIQQELRENLNPSIEELSKALEEATKQLQIVRDGVNKMVLPALRNLESRVAALEGKPQQLPSQI